MLTPLLHSLFYGFSRILEYTLTGKCRSFMGITIIANFRLVKRISKFHILVQRKLSFCYIDAG